MPVGVGEARPAVNDTGLDGMSADKDGCLEDARRGVPGRAAGTDGRAILAQPLDGGIVVAGRLLEGLLAEHHAHAGPLPQFVHHRRCDRHFSFSVCR